MPACVSSGQQTLVLGTQQGRESGCLGCSGPQPGRQDSAVGKCVAYGVQCLQGGNLACALLQTPFSGDLSFPVLSVDTRRPGLRLWVQLWVENPTEGTLQ